MKLKLTDEQKDTLSYDDVAYLILKETNKKAKIQDLFKEVVKLLDLPESVYENNIGEFFELIVTDKRFIMFDKVIAFDHLKQQIFFIANVKTDRLEEHYEKAKVEIENMIQLVKKGKEKEEEPLQIQTEFKPLFQKEEFCNMVEKAKHYILEGDIFQVVLSNRLTAKAEGSLLDTYRILRGFAKRKLL